MITLSCQNKKYLDVYIKENQRGWCFLFYTSDTTKFKPINGNYVLHLDSNNVAYVPSKIMESQSYEYELRVLNEKGEVLNDLFKMIAVTEINYKKVKEFYYPTDKEQQMPRSTFTNSTEYQDSLRIVNRQKDELLTRLNY